MHATLHRAGARVSTRRALFDDCYRAHKAAIFRLGLRYGGGDDQWAEDLAHDVFVKLWEHLPRMSDPSDAGGWLYRVAANLAVTRLRRRRWWARWVDQRVAARPPADDRAAERRFEQREEALRALETLRELPGKERVVVAMKVLDGLSQREIAETLGMSEGYVSKLVKRGLDRIRSEGWEVDDG